MEPNHYIPHEQLATQVMNFLQLRLEKFSWLASGSSSIAFRMRSSDAEFVLRIASPNSGKSANYESDFAIRRNLSQLTSFVAKPIVTNHDIHLDGIFTDWAVDAFSDGFSPERGGIPKDISVQLGVVLCKLHSLPVKRYGPLENKRNGFSGIADDRRLGFLMRFEKPWPFGCTPLQEHPAVVHEPRLVKPLLDLKPALYEFGVTGTQAIVHGDLHEKQILINDNRLSALLDFNESFVGRPEWDLGSYLYFHGPECLTHLLKGYCVIDNEQHKLRNTAWLAAILIALHHGNRSTILNRPSRLVAAVHFLEKQLLPT